MNQEKRKKRKNEEKGRKEVTKRNTSDCYMKQYLLFFKYFFDPKQVHCNLNLDYPILKSAI